MLYQRLCARLPLTKTLFSNTTITKFHTLRRLDNVSLKCMRPPVTTPKRNFFWIFRKLTKRELRIEDKVPDSYVLIYRNGLDNSIRPVQNFLFFSSILMAVLCIYKSEDFGRVENKEDIFRGQSPFGFKIRDIENGNLYALAGYLTFTGLLYFYVSRMPLRIYYNGKKQNYIMSFYGFRPDNIKQQIVRVGEIESHPSPENLMWKECSYRHKSGYKLIMFDNYFRTMGDLYVMLGIQKDHSAEGYVKPEDK